MKLFLFFLLLFPAFLFAQRIDTVIDNGIYKSYYNYSLREPVFVVYPLYKGGGPCSRRGMYFKPGGVRYPASFHDYYKTGYDMGHLANFEDFASDCNNGESTFRFYNCLPQTPNLNRGIWKRYEYMIRSISQNEHLLVICGGYSYTKRIGLIAVPDYCWKVVYSLDKHVIVYCLMFTNDNDAKMTQETVSTLENKLGYSIRGFLK